MYFPSLLIIFPKSETAKSSFSKYNIFSSTGANPESSDLRLVSPPSVPGDDDYDNHDDYGDGGHKYADHGDQNYYDDDDDEKDERKCLIDFFLSSNYYKPSKYNWLCWQQISNIVFPRILL